MEKLVIFLFFITIATPSFSTPLSLNYQITPTIDDKYEYSFSLILDNNDDSWSLGQGFGWLVFGDSQIINTSPFADFKQTNYLLAEMGPWTKIEQTTGGHNGPNFAYVLDLWYPTTIGDMLSWSGTSKTLLAPGSLLFSTIQGTPDIVRANFEVATDTTPVPEPTTIILLTIGILMITAMRTGKRKKEDISHKGGGNNDNILDNYYSCHRAWLIFKREEVKK